jgi:hypothetical protein
MFFMVNDGDYGPDGKADEFLNRCRLVQRMFIIKLLICEGITVTPLRGAQFRNSKVGMLAPSQVHK